MACVYRPSSVTSSRARLGRYLFKTLLAWSERRGSFIRPSSWLFHAVRRSNHSTERELGKQG